jgi:hypothetical protein
MRIIRIGEQDFEIRYGQNAICALEDELGMSIIEILKRVQDGRHRLTDLRAIIWAGLLAKRRNFTPETVGAIIEDGNARIQDFAFDCVEELAASFNKYIRLENGREDSEKNE